MQVSTELMKRGRTHGLTPSTLGQAGLFQAIRCRLVVPRRLISPDQVVSYRHDIGRGAAHVPGNKARR
jgi:hypothetical protein